jgi:hypothetical protein
MSSFSKNSDKKTRFCGIFLPKTQAADLFAGFFPVFFIGYFPLFIHKRQINL